MAATAVWAGDFQWQQGADQYYYGQAQALNNPQAAAAAAYARRLEWESATASANGDRKKGGAAAKQKVTAKGKAELVVPAVAPGIQLAAPPGYFDGQQAVSGPQARNRFAGTPFAPHRLCNHYAGLGWCRKEDQCTFAHGIQELHPEVQTKLAQTLPPGTLLPVTSAQMVQMQDEAADGCKDARLASVSSCDSPTAMKMANGCPAASSKAFVFNSAAAPFVATKFRATASVFVPQAQAEAAVAFSKADGSQQPAEAAKGAAMADATACSSTSPLSVPGIARRQAPKPLTLASETSPAEPKPATILMSSPTASFSNAAPGARRVSLAMSPKASASPTSSFQIQMSPTASLMIPAASPTARAAVTWSSMSPKSQVVTPTATLLDRNTLLQARPLAKKIEVGPPGLDMFAPTPTSAARGFGFQFPAPGYVQTLPAKGLSQTVKVSKAKAAAHIVR